MTDLELEKLAEAYGDLAEDINKDEVNIYLRYHALHIDGFIKEVKTMKDPFYKVNMPSDHISFLKELLKYERTKQYKYEKTYKTICAVRISLLLPRGVNTSAKKKALIKKYFNEINPLKSKLPMLAYEVTRGTATYIIMIISEREYLNLECVKRYNRNYTNKDGDITHKKGDPILDKAGNEIKQHILFSNKVRIFTFSGTYDHFIADLKEKYLTSIKSVLKVIRHKFHIKTKTCKQQWHFYNRKVCLEINHAKKYIEYMCNHVLFKQYIKVKDDPYADRRGKAIPTPHYKEIESIFFKYYKRFEKEAFHDEQGLLRKIAYKRVELPELQKNLMDMIEEFKVEICRIDADVLLAR